MTQRRRFMRNLGILASFVAWLWCPFAQDIGAAAQEIERPPPEIASGRTTRTAVVSKEYMVVAAHPLAAEAGAEMIAAGGTAADAMIAAQLVLNLVEPQSSGIGGGAFLLYYNAGTATLETLDGRETAPAAATPDLFLDDSGKPMRFMEAVVGGRSVGTPGLVRLLEESHRRYGRLPWRQLFAPAISLAETGFRVTPRLAAQIAKDAERLRWHDATRRYFFQPDGSPLQAGDLLRNPDLAATLRSIAENGADSFYTGEIAHDIVETVQQAPNPGRLAVSDLAAYRVIAREPVCSAYRLYRICGMGPPSSGALTIGQILGMLERFDLAALQPMSVEAIHLFVEASKLAFADRNLYMADADKVRMPTKGLLDDAYLATRAKIIDPSRVMGRATAGTPPWHHAQRYAPDESLEIPATSQLSIIDKDGNIVSLTTTIEAGFGSRLMVRGFLLNNELTDFSFVPTDGDRPVANRVEPYKRPRSSMAPTIVFDMDDRPVLVIGSSGGSRIIPYVAQTLIAVLDWKLDLQSAIALPHVANLNGSTDLEADMPVGDLKAKLEALGHRTRLMDMTSGLHGIQVDGDRLVSGVDPRREGMAVGQ